MSDDKVRFVSPNDVQQNCSEEQRCDSKSVAVPCSKPCYDTSSFHQELSVHEDESHAPARVSRGKLLRRGCS